MIEKVFWDRLKFENAKAEDDDAMFGDEKTEEAYFKLLSTLTRNVTENAILVKKMNLDMD
jgi:hypothetical protein